MSSEKSKCIKKYHRTVVSVVFCCFSAWRTAVHDVQPSDRTSPQGAKPWGIQFSQKATQIAH
nr:MAG TPA: ATP synthase [Caudoviricetes sp.]